jgi:hypothetical protein
MHPPRFTIGQLLFIVTAFSIGLTTLKGNDLSSIGLSMLMIIGLLGAALGASPDAGRPGPPSPPATDREHEPPEGGAGEHPGDGRRRRAGMERAQSNR